jgi:S1-C subfamily serine protease
MVQMSNPVSHSDPGGLVANSEGRLVGMISPAFIKTPSFRRVEELIDALNRKMAELAERVAKAKEKKPGDERRPRLPRDEVKKGITRRQLPPDMYDPALSQGINFAIPGNTLKQVCDRIIHKKKQPWVGVLVRPLMPPEEAQYGVKGIFILQVVPNSPASNSGLRSNDIIMTAGGKELRSGDDFRGVIEDTGVGGELKLAVYRKKNEMEIKITLGERK